MKACSCRPDAVVAEFSFAEHVFIVDRRTCSQDLWTLGREGGSEHGLGPEAALSLLCRRAFQDSNASCVFVLLPSRRCR